MAVGFTFEGWVGSPDRSGEPFYGFYGVLEGRPMLGYPFLKEGA